MDLFPFAKASNSVILLAAAFPFADGSQSLCGSRCRRDLLRV
jgi:hypothetical protein